jgi:anti-repressor protein
MAMTAGLRAKYDRHIKSARWRNMRRDLMRWRGAKCERCGRAKVRLCLHHKTYARFGNEAPADVELLCCVCHKPADSERRRVMKQPATVLNFEAHRLHALKRSGSELIWFVLNDVCEILGIDRTNATRSLQDKQKGVWNSHSLGGRQQMVIVREDGVYKLACTSRNPIAERFADWLYCKVLPEIRRTGAYHGTSAPLDALIGEMQLAFDFAASKQSSLDNVVQLPIVDPLREEAELEAYCQFARPINELPRGLIAINDQQKQAFLEAFARLPRQGELHQWLNDAPQVCYGPDGRLVERWDFEFAHDWP